MVTFVLLNLRVLASFHILKLGGGSKLSCSWVGTFNTPWNSKGVIASESYVAFSKSRVSFFHLHAAVGIRELLSPCCSAMTLNSRREGGTQIAKLDGEGCEIRQVSIVYESTPGK